jgi:hypothetical protein
MRFKKMIRPVPGFGINYVSSLKNNPMKIAAYRQRPDFNDNVTSKNLTTRIMYSAAVFLALIALAVVATIVVYWSLNNGTFAKFSL